MDHNDDINIDMGEEPLSDEQIEELLRGKFDPVQSFGAVAQIAELISAAKMPATSAELAGENDVVAIFREASGLGSIRNIRYDARRKVHSGFLAAKVVGVLAAATVLTGTAVAAYHGELPETFQTTVSSGLAHVGISVPTTHKPAPQASSSPTSPSPATNKLPLPTNQTKTSLPSNENTSTTRAQQNSAANGVGNGQINGYATYGLCIAYGNYQGSENSDSSSTSTTSAGSSGGSGQIGNPSASQANGPIAFSQLEALAAQNHETVSQLCANAIAPNGENTTNTKNARSSSAKEFRDNGHAYYGSANVTTTTTTQARNSGDSYPGYKSSNSTSRSNTDFSGNPFANFFKRGGIYGNGADGSSLRHWNR